MGEPLKNMYNKEFVDDLLVRLTEFIPDIDKKLFRNQVFTNEWDNMELKQRMRHITITLNRHMSGNFKKDADIIVKLSNILMKETKELSFGYMFLPDYIEVYGQDHFDISVDALHEITKFMSCEFAVRPFIVKDQNRMLDIMFEWSESDNYAVRRCSTEGCRPRLPWAIALPKLKSDPSPILPILEGLKDDDSETVRRSVANNLNDISKDNPELVIDIAKRWLGESEQRDKLVKHACRTLLKAGNSEVMQLFGFENPDNIKLLKLKNDTTVKIGDNLNFSFVLSNPTKNDAKIRLEYGIYFRLANGNLSRKVFKISEKVYKKQSESVINSKHSFRVITTKKFYPGEHKISIIVNGIESAFANFNLTN